MKITLETGKDNVVRVFRDGCLRGIIKTNDHHLLCYDGKRHTTTENLNEVIRFFNGDYKSYYYRGNER